MEQEKSVFKVRRAGIDDLPAIYALCKPYYEKTLQAKFRPFNQQATLDIFTISLGHPQVHSYLVESDGLVWAYGSLCYELSFSGGYDACLKFFYTDPLARGTAASRLLAEALVNDFYENAEIGNIMMAEAQSEIEDDGGVNATLFNNLFKKFGFIEMSEPTVYLVNKGKK